MKRRETQSSVVWKARWEIYFWRLLPKYQLKILNTILCQETLGTFCSCRPSWPRTASNVTFSESNHLSQQVGQFAKKTPTTKYAILKINVSLIQQIFQGYVTNLYLKTTKTILSFYFQSNIRPELYRVLVSCLLNHFPFNFPYLIFSHRLENGIRF